MDFSTIENLTLELAGARYDLLKSRGWSQTSDTPHNRWMWKKEYAGKIYLVSEDTALDIEELGIWGE